MSGNYTRWYREGTITIEQDSVNVTGKNTNWNTAGLKPGDILGTTNSTQFEIDSIIDDTHLTLRVAYPSSTIRNHNYYIIRNFNASFGAQAAAQATALCSDVKRYIDGKQETLKGKSAYEVALDDGFVGTQSEWLESLKGIDGVNGVAGADGSHGDSAYIIATKNGYTGTEQEWLESLKAAGEWSELDARTTDFVYATADSPMSTKYRSVIQRRNRQSFSGGFMYGRYLGTTITAAQRECILNQTFSEFLIGDYWRIPARTVTFTREDPSGVETEYSVDIPLMENVCQVADFTHRTFPNSWSLRPHMEVGFLHNDAETIRQAFADAGLGWMWQFSLDGDVSGAYLSSNVRKTIQSFGVAYYQSFFGDLMISHVRKLPSAYDSTTGMTSYSSAITLCDGLMIEDIIGHQLNNGGESIYHPLSYYRLHNINQGSWAGCTCSLAGAPGETGKVVGFHGTIIYRNQGNYVPYMTVCLGLAQ